MKNVIITGAGSGIGAAIAQVFAKNNWHTVLVGRTEAKLRKTQEQLGTDCTVMTCDQSNRDSITQLARSLQDQDIAISALINNAAIYLPSSFAEADDDNWLQQINTNLLGPVRLTKALWSNLVQNKAVITNVSSTLGLRPIENTGAYSATKAALNSWTQTLALEAAPLGMRVNSICPGLVDTPIHGFHKNEDPQMQELSQKLQGLQPLGRMGQPMDIAEAVYFATSEKANWQTGSLISVDGGVGLTTREI